MTANDRNKDFIEEINRKFNKELSMQMAGILPKGLLKISLLSYIIIVNAF